MRDDEALKFARRVGRHTEWLSEAQIADLYRNRFTDARSQRSRLEELEDEAKAALARRPWLVLTLVPDEPGAFAVSRVAIDSLYKWWFDRERVDLIPNIPVCGTDAPTIGPRQLVLAGRDATSVPIGYRAAFHSDGSCVVAHELDGPASGNPSLYLDHLVGHVVEGIELSVGFAIELAGAGGLALVQAALHFPERQGLPIHAWDPSWANSTRLQRTPERVSTAHTLDLDAIADSRAELVAAAAVVAGHLAQHFGEGDALYLAPDGTVRIQQFSAKDRDHHVLPRARRHGIPTSDDVAIA